jgi:rhodanese-related sulfurtransferase
MRRMLCLITVFIFTISSFVFAYDKELAKSFYIMFSPMTPEVLAKNPGLINAKQLLEMIKNKEPFVILDVRTPEERAIVGITWKDRLEIPVHELFKEENLNKLPKDKKIVVICHTGSTRSFPAVLALRALGFMNAYALDGGIIELARQAGRQTYNFLH